MSDEPAKESACYHVADWRTCPLQSSLRHHRDLCGLCFPDGEIPEEVTHFVYARGGSRLHRSVDQGGEADCARDFDNRGQYSQVTSLLKREDITTIEDARRAAGGDA